MFETKRSDGLILQTVITNRHLCATTFQKMETFLNHQLKVGIRAVIFDFSAVQSIDYTALSALLEVYRTFDGPMTLAYCGLPKHEAFADSSCSLSQLLPLYTDPNHALSDPAFSKLEMATLNGIVLAGGAAQNVLPSFLPTSLLPLMGKSFLHHTLEGMQNAGIRNAIVDTGSFGSIIRKSLMTTQFKTINLGFLNDHPAQTPKGSYNTIERLSQLNNTLSAFSNDTVISIGNAMPDVDFAKAFREHKERKADITVCVSGARSHSSAEIQELLAYNPSILNAVFTGCLFFRNGLFEDFEVPDQHATLSQVLKKIAETGGAIHFHFSQSKGRVVTNLRSYFEVLSHSLVGGYQSVSQSLTANKNGVWLHPEAEVSSTADIRGPCYIGAGVKISAKAELQGPVAIESGCEIGQGARIHHSVISNEHRAPPRALRRDVIAFMDWVGPLATPAFTQTNQAPKQHVRLGMGFN
ncbi:MAG: STAS domain-containing protein [Pseudoruegeria sp.]